MVRQKICFGRLEPQQICEYLIAFISTDTSSFHYGTSNSKSSWAHKVQSQWTSHIVALWLHHIYWNLKPSVSFTFVTTESFNIYGRIARDINQCNKYLLWNELYTSRHSYRLCIQLFILHKLRDLGPLTNFIAYNQARSQKISKPIAWILTSWYMNT